MGAFMQFQYNPLKPLGVDLEDAEILVHSASSSKDYLESRLCLEEAEKGGGEAAAEDDGEDGDQGGRCQKDLIRGSHKELTF